MPISTDNPWFGFLEENYPALFQAAIPTLPGNNAYNYWRQQGGRLQDLFMGTLGRMAMTGQAPAMTQTSFVSQYPFLNEWKKLSPWARGELAPTRGGWNVNG